MPAKAKMQAKSKLHRAFCENVKARRMQLGLTQQEVADAMGIAQPAYAMLESGKKEPRIKQIERVALALKINPALLIAGNELAAA